MALPRTGGGNALVAVSLLSLVASGHAATGWACRERVDQITGARSESIFTLSDNSVDFKFPYNGGSRVMLGLVDRTQAEKGVALIVTKGQFRCRPPTCKLRAKADDAVLTLTAVQLSRDSLRINYEPATFAQITTAGALRIETPMYEEAPAYWDFSPGGSFDCKASAASAPSQG